MGRTGPRWQARIDRQVSENGRSKRRGRTRVPLMARSHGPPGT